MVLYHVDAGFITDSHSRDGNFPTGPQSTAALLSGNKDSWIVALLVGDIRDRVTRVIVGVMMTPVLPVDGHAMSGAFLRRVNDIW